MFIWSMRHPASGYVQGINDLVTPFFVVFLSYYICECDSLVFITLSSSFSSSNHHYHHNRFLLPMFSLFLMFLAAGDKDPESFDLSKLPEDTLKMIEADSYWCLQKLLDGIQVCDNIDHFIHMPVCLSVCPVLSDTRTTTHLLNPGFRSS